VFVIVHAKPGSRERSWKVFPTALERDETFERLKAEARKNDDDGYFMDDGNQFYHSGNSITFKVPTLALFD
jgi:hypothetical protein